MRAIQCKNCGAMMEVDESFAKLGGGTIQCPICGEDFEAEA